MTRFPLHDENSAPEQSQAGLAATRKNFGMIPNLERVMASAPALLQAYSTTWDLFDETSLDLIERQVVYLTANFENECDYCVPWHTLLAQQANMPKEDIDALRNGGKLDDFKLNALYEFTRSLILNRGNISQRELSAFFDAGYNDVHALEVVLGLAVKTMSNYTNSIAGTPLDKEVAKFVWKKPRIGMREPENI